MYALHTHVHTCMLLCLCAMFCPVSDATQVDDALAKGHDPEIEAKRAASAQ